MNCCFRNILPYMYSLLIFTCDSQFLSHSDEHWPRVKRQILLKQLKPLLRESILPPDPDFHTKEVNTATERDRRYGAEEKLLWFCLCVATGKTLKQLERIQFKPDAEALRRIPGAKDGKFDRIWEVLSEQHGEYILKFKNGEVGVNPDPPKKEGEKKGFWSKIFS